MLITQLKVDRAKVGETPSTPGRRQRVTNALFRGLKIRG